MLQGCPCGGPAPYGSCCGRLHHGEAAATAEALMRSRYTAFTLGDAAYLRRTWDPVTRPRRLDLDPLIRWAGLEVLGRTGGGPEDDVATVAFRAHHAGGGVEEDSAFRREAGRWLYVGPVATDGRH